MITVTEEQLQEAVRKLAKYLGVLYYHPFDSRRSAPGFPDTVLAGTRGLIFAELKSAAGKLSPAQTAWRYMLLASGQKWVLWRPADWPGRIRAELEAIR